MKKTKTKVKVLIASALVMSSTAAVIHAAPNMKKSAEKIGAKNSVYLDVEKVESNKVKISLDNVEDIAKSVQFSIKLDDNVKIKSENGKDLITDLLVKPESEARESSSDNRIFTDYTYNEKNNTLDVIVTSKDYLPKSENKLEVCMIEVEPVHHGDRSFNITPNENEEFKYLAKDNTEYSNLAVSYNENPISLNTAPTIEINEGKDTVNIKDGEELVFSNLEGIVLDDVDKEDKNNLKLEVRNVTNVEESKEDNQETITKFSTDKVGTYIFKLNAVDTMGEKSKPKYLYVNVQYDMNLKEPTIEGATNIEIQSGSTFKPLEGVTAKDAKGREVEVTVSGDLDLNPEETKVYELTYTAVDRYGKKAEVVREVKVIANTAPVITGVEDKVINIGDNFDPMDGVKVEDDKDKNLVDEVKVSGTVNTSVAGEYKLSYSVTDSGNKTTRVQRVIRVNRAPIVSGYDSSIVIKSGTEVTEKMVLGGVNISDETSYETVVKLPEINGAGTYKAKIVVTDIDGAVTEVSRNIVVSDESVVKLPNSGEGTSAEDTKLIQVIDKDGIDLLNNKLSAATKDYTVDLTKKNFSNFVQYNIVISKKEAVFRNSEKTYLEVRVPNSVEESTGGIKITEYVEVLADSVAINEKGSLGHYLNLDDEVELTATVTPDNTTNKELDWMSSNEDILEITKTETGVKVRAKGKGLATIKVGTVDGSDKYDQITFDVTSAIKNLPEGVTVEEGDGTEESPVVYKTEAVDSLKSLLKNMKDEYKVTLEDRKVTGSGDVDYYLKLDDKNIFRLFRSAETAKKKANYAVVRVPNTDEFKNELYTLDKKDTEAPKFVNGGNTDIETEVGKEFVVPTIKAVDNFDGDVPVTHVIKDADGKVVKSIDTSKEGKYTITYTAEDSSKNKSDLVMTVNVVKPQDTPEEKPELPEVKPGVPDQNPGDIEKPEVPEEKPGDAEKPEAPEEKPGDADKPEIPGENLGEAETPELPEVKPDETEKVEDAEVSDKKEDSKDKSVSTGVASPIGIIGASVLALGGIFGIKRKKK